MSHSPPTFPQSIAVTDVLCSRVFNNARTRSSALLASAASAMPARLRPAAAATKRRDRRVSERIQSIADIDTLQEDNFDVASGRHFDHRLILLGALDQIFRDHVARLGHALANAPLQNLTGRELFALSVGGVRKSTRLNSRH